MQCLNTLIITSFSMTYSLLHADGYTYLFHFAYLMYKPYNYFHHSQEEKMRKCCYTDRLFNAIDIFCTILVIVIDLLLERTVFAT